MILKRVLIKALIQHLDTNNLVNNVQHSLQ